MNTKVYMRVYSIHVKLSTLPQHCVYYKHVMFYTLSNRTGKIKLGVQRKLEGSNGAKTGLGTKNKSRTKELDAGKSFSKIKNFFSPSVLIKPELLGSG